MAGCCGQMATAAAWGFDPTSLPWIDVNQYGVRPMGDDAENCEPYHGAYQGTSVFLVGYGTEVEKLFTRDSRSEAWQLAVDSQTTFQHISAVELCHDRIFALFGA